jgi:DeoR/GlpR family transcriptional regulator of sugar metabolism
MKKTQSEVYERQEKLLDLLSKKKEITVEEAVTALKVSPVTVRRDLLFLEKKKLIERFYGGARLINSPLNNTHEPKQETPIRFIAKHSKDIAAYIIEQTKPYDTIFISSGKLTINILEILKDEPRYVLTNDARAISLTYENTTMKLGICGGELSQQTNALTGRLAIQTISHNTFQLSIFEVEGITANEATTKTLNESHVYRMAKDRTTGPSILLAEKSKLGRNNGFMIEHTSLFTTLLTNETDINKTNELLNNKISVINRS